MTTKAVCDACGRVFSNPYSLKQHLKTHSEVKPFECSTCKKTFRYRQSFQEHLKRHKKLKTVQCDICGKRFYTHRELNSHLKLHLPSSQYHCSKCNLYFKEDKSLKAHCNKQHITKYKCCYCPAVFSNRKVWKSHEFRNHVHKKEKLNFQENVNEKKMMCNQSPSNELRDKSCHISQHVLKEGPVRGLGLVNQSPKRRQNSRDNIQNRKSCADNSSNLKENNQDVKHRENVNDQKQFKGETSTRVNLISSEHINSENVHSSRKTQQASSLHSSKAISYVENEQFELQRIADASSSDNTDQRFNQVYHEEFQTNSEGYRPFLGDVNNAQGNQVKRHPDCKLRTSSDVLNNEESCKFYANPLAKCLSYENNGEWRSNAENREIVKPSVSYDSDYRRSLGVFDDKSDDIMSDGPSEDKNQTHYAVFINDEAEDSQLDSVQGSVELDVNNITVYSDDNETYEEMQHEFDEFDEQFKTDIKSGFSCSCKVRESSEALQKYFDNYPCRNRSQCTAKARLDTANAESKNTDRDSPKAFQTYFAKCAQPNRSLKECRPRESCEAFQKYFEKYSIQGSFDNLKTQDMQHTIHLGPSSVTDILPCFIAATKCTLPETNTENVGDIYNNESIIVDSRLMIPDMSDKALDLSSSKSNSVCVENSSVNGSGSVTETEQSKGKLRDKSRYQVHTRLCEQTTTNATFDISDTTAVYKTATPEQEAPYRYDKLFLVPKIPEKRVRRSKVIKTVNSVENVDKCLSKRNERNLPTPLGQGLSTDRLPRSKRKVSIFKNTCYEKEENKDKVHHKLVACEDKVARKPTSIFRTDKNGTRILIGIIDPNKGTPLPLESKEPTTDNMKNIKSPQQAANSSDWSVENYQNLQRNRSVDENSAFTCIATSSAAKEIRFPSAQSGHLDRLSCHSSIGRTLISVNAKAVNAYSVNHDSENNYSHVAQHYSKSDRENRTNEFALSANPSLCSSSAKGSLTLKRALDECPSTTKLLTPVCAEFQTAASSLQPPVIPDIQSRTRSMTRNTDTRVIDYSMCSKSYNVCVPEQITELEDSLKETLIKLRNKSGYKDLLSKMFDLVQTEQSCFE